MTQRPRVVKLYESSIPSGNAYKVSLLLTQLGQRFAVEQLDILAKPSQTRTTEFLAKNPNGRIPVVELEDGSFLSESNAILFYLAEGTPYLSDDPLVRARTMQWLFFEQYSHEPYVAVLKFWTIWGGLQTPRAEDLELWKLRGQAALLVMNDHLAKAQFFSGERYGIADIALFAYTQSAERVGFDMQAVPRVGAWLDRVRTQPGYVEIATH